VFLTALNMKIHESLIKKLARFFDAADPATENRREVMDEIDRFISVVPESNLIRLYREGGEKYRFLTENIFDVIWVLDLELKIQYMSPSCFTLTGYTDNEIMDMNIEKIITGGSFDMAMQKLLSELKLEVAGGADPERTIYLDLEFNRRDGTTVWAESRITFLRESGTPVGFLGVTRDNSSRREAEEKLRRNEERYRTILENIEDGYYETDLSGRFMFFNGAFCRMTGFAPEDLHGISYKKIVPEDSRDRVFAMFHDVFEKEAPLGVMGVRLMKKDGSEGYGELSVSLRHGPDGAKTGFCGILRETTEKKKMEEALRLSERKWRSLYSNIPGGSFLVDEDFIISDANAITCAITGYRYDELVGKECSVICPDDRGECSCPLFMQGLNKIDNSEGFIKTKDGKKVPIIKSAQKIRVSTGEIMLTNFHDISKMKDIEEALRKSEETLRERNQKIEKDLHMAQLIQKSLLHTNIPALDWVKVDYRYLPLDEVGGDYFSLTPLREGGLGVFIGDVSSHGVTAALFLSLVKATSERICRSYALAPAQYVTMLNLELIGNMPLSFLTATYGVFSPARNARTSFTFSSAGHPYPILFRASTGEAEFVKCKGKLIGVFKDLEFDEKRIDLEKGDRIFLYTDGVPETVNIDNDIIGYDRLPEMILEAYDRSLEKTMDNIMEAVNRFKGGSALSDDIVLLGFEAL
jgi:PAS domain S-box-containing protein